MRGVLAHVLSVLISESTSEAVNGGIVTSDQSIKTFRFVWRPFSLIPFLEFAVHTSPLQPGGGAFICHFILRKWRRQVSEKVPSSITSLRLRVRVCAILIQHFTGHHIRTDENRPRACAFRSGCPFYRKRGDLLNATAQQKSRKKERERNASARAPSYMKQILNH